MNEIENELYYQPNAFDESDSCVMFEATDETEDFIQTVTINRDAWKALGSPNIISVRVSVP